jgi:hypothetical protein
MLLGVTTLGGDEPLGGFNIPERPEALFATTNFDLNTVIASPFCSVDLSGDILGLANPFGDEQFEYGQAFSDIITGEAQCIGLDDSLALPCFPDVIVAPPPSVGLTVPRNIRLNAEFDTYGLSGQVIAFDPATVTMMQVDVLYLDNDVANPVARVTQLSVEVIYPTTEAERTHLVVYGQDATLTYSGA